MGNKPTKAEMDIRVREIHDLLLAGKTRSEIQQYAQEKWKLTENPIDRMMARAREIIQEVNLVGAKDLLATIVKNHWDLYMDAKSEGDRAEARANLAAIAKLKGLEEFTLVIEDKRELGSLDDELLDDASTAPEIYS